MDNGPHTCPATYEKELCRLLKVVKLKEPWLILHVRKHYPALRKFIVYHERADRERVARAVDAHAEKMLRKNALKKLTQAERCALGIRGT